MKRLHWIMGLVVCGLWTLAGAQQAVALPPPDNSSSESSGALSDDVLLMIDNVDDIAFGFVWNGGDDLQRVAYCEWENGNHGATTVKLDGKVLNKGMNYLIVVLYNQKFEGVFGGKYSGNFKVKKNGDAVWTKSVFERRNNAEIVYWKVLQLEVQGDKVEVSEKAPDDVVKALKPVVAKMEVELVDKAPVKRLNTAGIISEVLSGL
ncbi:MAG: hypothetical protein U0939_20180 [Pirellulales bacterium]